LPPEQNNDDRRFMAVMVIERDDSRHFDAAENGS
jgi:hypothetical protein